MARPLDPRIPRAIHLGRPIAGARLTVGLSGENHLTALPMTTDHQINEHQATDTERGLGTIVTALILLATFATVALLVTR